MILWPSVFRNRTWALHEARRRRDRQLVDRGDLGPHLRLQLRRPVRARELLPLLEGLGEVPALDEVAVDPDLRGAVQLLPHPRVARAAPALQVGPDLLDLVDPRGPAVLCQQLSGLLPELVRLGHRRLRLLGFLDAGIELVDRLLGFGVVVDLLPDLVRPLAGLVQVLGLGVRGVHDRPFEGRESVGQLSRKRQGRGVGNLLPDGRIDRVLLGHRLVAARRHREREGDDEDHAADAEAHVEPGLVGRLGPHGRLPAHPGSARALGFVQAADAGPIYRH
jgi:hypothetical protein